MAVRLDVTPASTTHGVAEPADVEPATRGLGSNFGLALLKLSTRRSGRRWPGEPEPGSGRGPGTRSQARPLVLLEDHFALRTLCRA
ncbi:hypothetical protein B0I33_111243 [Prauserella shujinwangii]|uniref:Uncharacterized protein n=1 Tax=Prauserella shujinwangii TaxID=1453103 RepID=A0A2T0LNJ5_9PSEU|nr:hypothetical protein [Prauserella shujinwangii]PRX44729.1 hypothetical protein B0I33_111243 [Prauserella shujinwangii]